MCTHAHVSVLANIKGDPHDFTLNCVHMSTHTLICMYTHTHTPVNTHKMFPAQVGVHPLTEDPASPLHWRRRKHGVRRSMTALGHTSAGGVHGEGEAYENNDHGHTHASMP